MPCPVSAELKRKESIARERFALNAYKENEGIRGVSKTKAASIAREEQRNISALAMERHEHEQHCPACKEDR